MRAGKLRHKVLLQELVTGSPATDPSGEPNQSWEDVRSLRVDISPVSQGSREAFLSDQIASVVQHEINARYAPDIVAQQRLVKGDRIFSIHFVVNVGEMGRELKLFCSEGLNQG